MKKIVSVVIPTYNSSNTIRFCLDSLVNQNFKNFEVIIVDNFSDDNTKFIIEEYHKKLNIKFYQINNNNIIAKSRNLGIEKASTNWIAFLDSDDYWDKKKLRECINFLTKSDVIYHDILIKKLNKIKYKSIGRIEKPFLKNYLLSGNIIFTSSLLFKKFLAKKVGGVNENQNIVTSEDYNFLLKILNHAKIVSYIKKPLTIYNIHDNNVSKKKFDWSISFRNSIKEFLYILNDQEKKLKKSEIVYLKVKYFLEKKKNKRIFKLLSYCIINGSNILRIKSLILFFLFLFR